MLKSVLKTRHFWLVNVRFSKLVGMVYLGYLAVWFFWLSSFSSFLSFSSYPTYSSYPSSLTTLGLLVHRWCTAIFSPFHLFTLSPL